MKLSTSLSLLVLLQKSTTAFASRPATWSDWEFFKDFYFQRIQDSTCPDPGSDALRTHWDYDYEGFRQTMSEEEALNQDCTLFHRFRNPSPLGTRLIRHVFHDSAGGFDGFVNIHDLVENPSLHATDIVLREDYDSLEVPDGDNGETIPIKQIISFADFTAWAGHAALLRTVALQNRTDKTGERLLENEPKMEVRVGRPTYEPTSDDDHGPPEHFPTGLGAQGPGQLIADYFADEFAFTAEETVTIMGAHTLGGARREDSGFSGMWTQSKGKFNNDFQLQVVFPLPQNCLGPDNCSYFSEAGEDILADIDLKQTCVEGEDSDRCYGWQQTMRRGMAGTDIPDKFQWQHSCRDDGSGCTHLMLNIDIGLFYDLEGYICTAADEANNVPATAGRTCKEGMIKGYPTGSACNQDDARVLATCFEPNEDTNSHLSFDAENMEEWASEFGVLFDSLTTHKMLDGKQIGDLTILTPSASCARNDNSWTYTTDVRPNGSGGTEKNCNFILRDPAARCALIGDDGVPAYEACCLSCAEYTPNRSQGFSIDEGSSDKVHSSTTIFESDLVGGLSSAGAKQHFLGMLIAATGASVYLLF